MSTQTTLNQIATFADFFQEHRNSRIAVLYGGAGSGKAIMVSEPILTRYSGWKTISDIEPGMWVYDDNGSAVKVIETHGPYYNRDCYRVSFDNGDSIVADASHDWIVGVERDSGGYGKYTTFQIFEKTSLGYRVRLPPYSHPYRKECFSIHRARYITSVVQVPSVPVKCLTVDNKSHLFLVGKSLVPTHNSVSTAQHIVLKLLLEDNIRIMVVRKTLPSLKVSAFQLIKDILGNLGVRYQLNKTEMTLAYKNNLILFRGLDDPEKVKSIELNYAWIEEATDVTQADINQLNLRLRRANPNGSNQLYLTFNPIDANHHIITKIIEPTQHGQRSDVAIHHSTYKDNPYLDDVYIETLENLINTDENFYKIYCLGQPGVLKGQVFTNWKVADASYDSIWRVPPIGYGADWGYNHPTAMTALWFRDGNLYARQIFYKRKQTNPDVIEWVKAQYKLRQEYVQLVRPGIAFYGDAAEPARIEEFNRSGIPMYAADKDVHKGLEIMKSHQIIVHPESVDLIKELQNYKYKENKGGDGFIDEVVKAYDDLTDSFRYICATANIDGMVIPISVIKNRSEDPYLNNQRGFNSKFPYDPNAGTRSKFPFQIGLKPPSM